MSALVNAVNPTGDPYSGGSITRAGRPTGATGDFNSVGGSGFPNPNPSQIAIARNNQGTNVRIPYSRVVPMHGKDKLRVRDHRLAGTGTSEVYEYDGLEAGELAWVMGKQFAVDPRGGVNFPSLVAAAVEFAVLLHNVDAATDAVNSIAASWRSIPRGGFLQGPGGAAPVFPDPQTRAQRIAAGGAGWTGYVDAAGVPVAAPAAGNGVPLGPDGAAMVPQDAFGGYGPDRMQRMAYTNWVEAFFEQRIATQKISLSRLPLLDAAGTHAFLDADLAFYGSLRPRPTNGAGPGQPGRDHQQGPVNPPAAALRAAANGPPPPYLAGATVLCAPDLAYALQATPGMRRPDGTSGLPINTDLINRGHVDPNRMQVQVPMMQGLFLMEQGPFLRSYGTDHHHVDVRLPERFREWVTSSAFLSQTPKIASVDRHLGSSLAQKALYCSLKKHGVFNWVPDGVCLSKYATGPDGYADDNFDARSGQLLNIGVQGPCITKTWALGDSAMHAMPGDKVFMLVVGTVDYEVGSRIEDAATAAAVPIQRAANNLWDANAQITRDLAREGFTEDREPYRIPNPAAAGPGVAPTIVEPNRSRPNAARYASRANELAAAEAARRVLYATNGTCDNARDQLATWLQLDAAAADTNQSVEFKHLVDAMNNLRAVADPSTDGEPLYMAYREAAVAQLKVVQNAFSGVARANVALGTVSQYAAFDSQSGDANVPGSVAAAAAGGGAAVNVPRRAMQDYATTVPLAGTELTFGAVAADVRAGRRPILKAELSNIHLKRATSSFLANTSHFNTNDPKSRCGLKIGYNSNQIGNGAPTVNPERLSLVQRGMVDPGPGAGAPATRQFQVQVGGELENGLGGRPNNPIPATSYYATDDAARAARERPDNPHPQALRGMRSDNVGSGTAPQYATIMPIPDVPRPTTYTDQGSLVRRAMSGTSEFIIGAWCIGTVTDSAASRAVMHANQVRTAPSSMAINVNVNVEWWDGDKLYQHYMDKDRGHYYEKAAHPAVELARKEGQRVDPVDTIAGGGFDLRPTVVQKPQHTVLARNEPSTRNTADYVREVTAGSIQTKSADDGALGGARALAAGLVTGLAAGQTGFGAEQQDAVFDLPSAPAAAQALRGLAVNRLSTGKGEYEGMYVQPDPRGVDEDPEGLRIYDLRTLTDVDVAAGAQSYANAAGGDVALVETRHWSAARNSFIQ